MAKYHGMIGFAVTKETSDDTWSDEIEERPYYGDITRNFRKHVERDQVLDDIRLNMQVSIVADSFAFKNFQTIKYITLNGMRWKVMTIEVAYPRLVLEVGEIYNG